MVTKPHYRQFIADSIKPGDRVYSRLVSEAVEIDNVAVIGGRLALFSGCLELRISRGKKVWVETKPRGLK